MIKSQEFTALKTDIADKIQQCKNTVEVGGCLKVFLKEVKKLHPNDSNFDIQELYDKIEFASGVSKVEIRSKVRKPRYVYARMIFVKKCTEVGITSMRAGQLINKDHSTVAYYLKKYKDELMYNSEFKEIVNKINNE
jgi:chromosomal replication initiation ATPase DnaA